MRQQLAEYDDNSSDMSPPSVHATVSFQKSTVP